ncbi:unnamed protein product, partial [Ectocarpus sp. 8 AP-2014]
GAISGLTSRGRQQEKEGHTAQVCVCISLFSRNTHTVPPPNALGLFVSTVGGVVVRLGARNHPVCIGWSCRISNMKRARRRESCVALASSREWFLKVSVVVRGAQVCNDLVQRDAAVR